MNNGPVTEGCAREQQTLRLGFDVFCLFPNLVVPTFLQSAVKNHILEHFINLLTLESMRLDSTAVVGLF